MDTMLYRMLQPTLLLYEKKTLCNTLDTRRILSLATVISSNIMLPLARMINLYDVRTVVVELLVCRSILMVTEIAKLALL